MGGFNIQSYWGVDATGVKSGTDYALQQVENGGKKMENAGRRAGAGFTKGTNAIYINKRKTSGAIVGMVRDMGNGMSAAESMSNAMMYLGKGVRGAVYGMVAAGALMYMTKKFTDARSSAKAMQETLDALDSDKLNAQNASVKELVAQLGKYQAAAKGLKEGDSTWSRLAEQFTGNGGQRARQAAQAKAGQNNMMNEVMTGQANAAKAAHLNATGRHKEAARQAFGVKRAGERADLEEGLKKGEAQPGEISRVLGDFDAETEDQLRAMGLRRIGEKGKRGDGAKTATPLLDTFMDAKREAAGDTPDSPLQKFKRQAAADQEYNNRAQPAPKSPYTQYVPGSDIFSDKPSWGSGQISEKWARLKQIMSPQARPDGTPWIMSPKEQAEAAGRKAGIHTFQTPYGSAGVHAASKGMGDLKTLESKLDNINNTLKATPLIRMK